MRRPATTKTLAKKNRTPRQGFSHLDSAALYERCANRLREEILSGALPAGKRLPSERVLADVTGFTRLTVRRALFSLEDSGALERASRRGWQVRTPPLSEPPNTLMGFTEMASARGLIASAKILKQVVRQSHVEESEQLRIAPGATLTEVVRLRMLDGEPIAIEELRIPTSRVNWPDGFNFTQSVHAALERAGVVPTRADALVDVIEAQSDEARLLGVVAGRGLLRLNSVTFGSDGVPISLDTIRYHPDRYRFRATLERRPR